jgi:hypothetical protein
MSITTYHPSSLVEVPPLTLAPLSEAVTEQQHQQELDEQQRQVSQPGPAQCFLRCLNGASGS